MCAPLHLNPSQHFAAHPCDRTRRRIGLWIDGAGTTLTFSSRCNSFVHYWRWCRCRRGDLYNTLAVGGAADWIGEHPAQMRESPPVLKVEVEVEIQVAFDVEVAVEAECEGAVATGGSDSHRSSYCYGNPRN